MTVQGGTGRAVGLAKSGERVRTRGRPCRKQRDHRRDNNTTHDPYPLAG